MSTVVYQHHSSRTNKGTTTVVDCTVTVDTMKKHYGLQLKGTVGQYIIFSITHKKGLDVNVYHLAKDTLEVTLDYKMYNSKNYYNYVFNCNKTNAECYRNAFPDMFYYSNTDFSLSYNKHGLYAICCHDTIKVYNSTSQPLDLEGIGTIQAYSTLNNRDSGISNITDLIVKKPKTSFKDLSFKDLTYEEQETMVPTALEAGTLKLNVMAKYNWVPATDMKVVTTLSYKETRDKEFHMIDDATGREYRYNNDTIRLLLPHMVKGKFTGTLIYHGTSGARSLTYTLVPISQQDHGSPHIRICDSDDSEAEDATEDET